MLPSGFDDARAHRPAWLALQWRPHDELRPGAADIDGRIGIVGLAVDLVEDKSAIFLRSGCGSTPAVL